MTFPKEVDRIGLPSNPHLETFNSFKDYLLLERMNPNKALFMVNGS